MDPEGLYGFLKGVEQRANEAGWRAKHAGVLWIPNVIPKIYMLLPVNSGGSFKCLIKNYGEIQIEHLEMWERMYFGLKERHAQDSATLDRFLINSLTKTG